MRKKRIGFFLMLMILIFSSSMVYAGDIKAEDNNKILKSIFNDDNILDMKKLSNGTMEDLNISSKTNSLSDGTYLLNRGTGWVLGGDKSFLKSAFVTAGSSGYIEVKDINIKEKTEYSGVTLDIGPDEFKVSIENSTNRYYRTEQALVSDFQIQAPVDKNIYMKLYATYNRYDLIKVKGNKIIGSMSKYEPEGSWLKYVTYAEGETVNQSDLEEKYTRCILGEPNEVKIKSSIKIQGADRVGQTFDSFRLGFDYSSNRILFLNRTNEFIHEGFGFNKYFKFRLLDKSKKEKISIELKGKDKSNDEKYDSLNNFKFEIGDYVEIYHEEPFRLEVSGQKEIAKEEIYIITEEGLIDVSPIDNTTISLSGSGGGAFELVFKDKVMKLQNRVPGVFANEYTGFSDYYIQVILTDNDGREKTSAGIFGSMYSQNVELNKLDGVSYEYGDILTIKHMTPKYINLNGFVIGDKPTGGTQKYEITKKGFKVIK